MKNKIIPLLWGGLASVVLFLVTGFVFKIDGFTALKSYGEEPTYKVYALELPDTLSFAGEKVPLDSPDLRERLDRELLVNTYWQSNMMLLLKRANKFFPTIEKILNEEGVPSDLKYLSSSKDWRMFSRRGQGFLANLRTTGREYGWSNTNVDERTI